VSWLIQIPVLPNAPDAITDYTITLDSPPFAAQKPQTDTDTFVIFHDSFDVSYGDGVQ